MAEMRVSKITYPDGTEKFMVEEVREHVWGRSIHPVMNPDYSQHGSCFVPIMLTHKQIEDALK